MSFLGRQLVKNVLDPGGNQMPPEPAIQFVSSASAVSVTTVDNPALGATVVTIPTGGGGSSQPAFGVGTWNQLSVPAAAAYTITGTTGVVSTGANSPLFASKANTSNVQIDTALIGGASFPSTGWFVEMVANDIGSNIGNAEQFPGSGACVATGTTGSDTAYAMFRYYGNTTPNAHVEHFHPGGARITFINDAFAIGITGGFLRTRILSDGTNIYYQVSNDGFYWGVWASEALPAGIAFWGFCMGNGASSGTDGRMALTILRSRQSATLNVPQSAIQNVANTTNAIIQSNGHGLNTGDAIAIHGVVGATGVNTSTGNGLANLWTVAVIDANHFNIFNGSGPGAYVSGGTVTCLSR